MSGRQFSKLLIVATAVSGFPVMALAEEGAPATAAATSVPAGASIGLELNKVESFDKGCRFFMVVTNPSDQVFQSFKLDMALFQPDGVIGRQFMLDLAPLKAQKKSVKQFDLEGIGCDKVGTLFVNDVRECKADAGTSQDCLQRLKTSTLSNVQLSK